MAKKGTDVTINFRAVTKGFQQQVKGLGASLKRLGDSMKSLGATASIAITAPLALAGREAFEAAKRFDQLKQTVTAVEGSAERGAVALDRLQKVSQLPGLTFDQAASGFVNLRALGFQLGETEAILAQFSNALALFGGSADDFQGIIRAITQIVGKNSVQAEEINQLAERFPQIRTFLEKEFGSAFGPDITKKLAEDGRSVRDFVRIVTNSLGELQDAPVTLESAWVNFTDTVTISLGEIAADFLNLNNVGEVFLYLAEVVRRARDEWLKLSPEVKRGVVIFALVAAAVGPVLLILGSLAGAVSALFTAFSALGGAIAAVAGLITLPLAIAMGVIAGFLVLARTQTDNWIDAILLLAKSVEFEFKRIEFAFRSALVLAAELSKAFTAFRTGQFGLADNIVRGIDTELEKLYVSIFDGNSITGEWQESADNLREKWEGVTGEIGGALERLKEVQRQLRSGELDLKGDGIITAKGTKPTQAELREQKARAARAKDPLLSGIPQLIDDFRAPFDTIEGFAEDIEQRVAAPIVAGKRALFEFLPPIDEVIARVRELTTSLERWEIRGNNTAALLSDLLVPGFEGLFTTLLEGGQNAFKAFLDSLKQMIVRLLTALAVATALNLILKSLFPGLSGVGGGLAKFFGGGPESSLFGSIFGAFSGFKIPGFAEGGIVRAATVGLIGEAGPEAIIPLDQLDRFMGGTQVTVDGEFVVRGDDLALVLANSEQRRKRMF